MALLSEDSILPSVHLVAEAEGKAVGHISFSPVHQKGLPRSIGYILAPLAVAPDWQKRGVGSALVKEGLRTLGQGASGAVLVYGDPDYYGRFGFTHQLAQHFLPPYPLKYPSGWQASPLDSDRIPDTPVEIECVPPLHLAELW